MKLSTINRIRMAKQLLKFVDIATDEGTVLTIDSDNIEVGKEAFMTNDEGELVPAEGTFHYDKKTIAVEGGIVKEIVEDAPETTAEEIVEEVVEAADDQPQENAAETTEEKSDENTDAAETEEPAEEVEDTPNPDQEKIAELEKKVSEYEAKIAELEAELAKAKEPAAEAAEEEFKNQNDMPAASRILAYVKNR